MAGRLALAAAVAAALLPVSGAGGADQQAPRRGGTVVFGNLTEPACLNVLTAACTSEATRYITELILLPAFDVSPQHTHRPRLVSRVTITKKPPFTLTYHIRPAARWSDGVQITARDFSFTHRARRAAGAGLSEEEREDLRRVRSVSRVDAKTVRVVLRSRYSGWRALFGNVLPAHALSGGDPTKVWNDRIVNSKTGRPIGSGPFLLGGWERGRQLTLVRNPRYWGQHRAYLERIVVKFRTESGNPVDWFRNRELDVAYGIFQDAVSALRREPGVEVLAEPSAGYQAFFFRTGDTGGHPALRGKQGKPVRRAIAYAIDRRALISEAPGQIDPDLRPLDSLLFPRQSPYYQPHWSRYRYRPALARRLLEEVGCRRDLDDGIYSCDGERLSLRFLTRAGNPGRARIVALAQRQLRGSGVEVVPEFAGPGAFETILSSGDFDVALFGFISTPNPTGNSIFGCGGSANHTGYCQRLVTRDLDQADRILDARQQARVMNRADAQMANDMPALPLFQTPVATAVRENIENFSQSLNPLANAEKWWLDD